MKLYHYFSQRTAKSPMKSTYEIGDGDGGVLLQPTGSAAKALRTLRGSGFNAPNEMNGPQGQQYTIELFPTKVKTQNERQMKQ